MGTTEVEATQFEENRQREEEENEEEDEEECGLNCENRSSVTQSEIINYVSALN